MPFFCKPYIHKKLSEEIKEDFIGLKSDLLVIITKFCCVFLMDWLSLHYLLKIRIQFLRIITFYSSKNTFKVMFFHF